MQNIWRPPLRFEAKTMWRPSGLQLGDSFRALLSVSLVNWRGRRLRTYRSKTLSTRQGQTMRAPVRVAAGRIGDIDLRVSVHGRAEGQLPSVRREGRGEIHAPGRYGRVFALVE